MLYCKPGGVHTKAFPHVPYAKNNKILWGTFTQAKADGLIAAIQVSRYATLSEHFISTQAFFKDCDVWKGSWTKPVYLLVWICKKSSHKLQSRVAKYHGKVVLEFFVSFQELGLPHFE